MKVNPSFCRPQAGTGETPASPPASVGGESTAGAEDEKDIAIVLREELNVRGYFETLKYPQELTETGESLEGITQPVPSETRVKQVSRSAVVRRTTGTRCWTPTHPNNNNGGVRPSEVPAHKEPLKGQQLFVAANP